MTSTVMLAAVRTILDEALASFWTDAEIYAALADGQNETIRALLAKYKEAKKANPSFILPYELKSVEFDDTGTDDNVAVPVGMLELTRATYDHNGAGGEEPCEILSSEEVLQREDNTFTTATSTESVVYIKSASDALTIYFLPAKDGTPAYTIWHITKPSDIAAGTNAALPVTTHSAIVNYAVSRMFEKDQRPQESQQYYGLFLKEVEGL